jgi:hypothetical protein
MHHANDPHMDSLEAILLIVVVIIPFESHANNEAA